MNYDKETDKCLDILETFNMITNEVKILDDDALFYDHESNTKKKMELLRKTFHKENRRKHNLSKDDNITNEDDKKTNSRKILRPISTHIFREIDQNTPSSRGNSEFMANCTTYFMPYHSKLKQKVLKSEKSNYITHLHNIFVGRTV
jgi:hypothetical protein